MTDTNVVNNSGTNEVNVLLHDLAKRHAHISVVFIAVLVLILGVGGFFGYRALRSFDKQVAALQTETAAAKTELANNKATRDDITKQQEVKVVVIHDRDTKAESIIAAVTAPKSVEQVASDSGTYLGAVPTITADSLLAYNPQTVQGFIATKIDRDRLFSDNVDLKDVYSKEQAKNLSLTHDLDTETSLAQKWEAVTVKSKWKKLFGGVKTGLIIGGTAFAAYEAGSHMKGR